MKEAAKDRDFTYLKDVHMGKTLTNEHRNAISKANMGKERNIETKNKIAQKLKGQKRTLEQCNNISKATKGVPKSPRTEEHKQKLRKKVIQFDINGNKIREFMSCTEAGNKLNIDVASNSKCCRGKQKTTGGYIWKFKK